MNANLIPLPQTEAWGFFGTMDQHAAAAWPLAMSGIASATGEPLESVRAFLDSRHGRHFADQVLNHLGRGTALPDAIDATIHTWMEWRIARTTSRQYGIPKGLPYLTGWVVHCGLED